MCSRHINGFFLCARSYVTKVKGYIITVKIFAAGSKSKVDMQIKFEVGSRSLCIWHPLLPRFLLAKCMKLPCMAD
jgi:hypothetical protein